MIRIILSASLMLPSAAFASCANPGALSRGGDEAVAAVQGADFYGVVERSADIVDQSGVSQSIKVLESGGKENLVGRTIVLAPYKKSDGSVLAGSVSNDLRVSIGKRAFVALMKGLDGRYHPSECLISAVEAVQRSGNISKVALKR